MLGIPPKTDVWMPLYIADYLADTSRLTTIQHGAYLLLIMDYWRNGPPPDDDAILAQITRMQPDAWSIARATIIRFFSIENGMLVHARIDAEIVKAGENAQKAHERAVKAAKARWEKEHAASIAASIANAALGECPSPSPSPSPLSIPTELPLPLQNDLKDLSAHSAQTVPSKKGTALREDWFLPKEWGEWALSEKPEWNADDVRRVAADFKDHWLANANQAKAKKADWLATWRKWVRSPLNDSKRKVQNKAAQPENFNDKNYGEGITKL